MCDHPIIITWGGLEKSTSTVDSSEMNYSCLIKAEKPQVKREDSNKDQHEHSNFKAFTHISVI